MNDYLPLYKEIARKGEVIAEQTIEFEEKRNNEENKQTALKMLDTFRTLSDNLSKKEYELSHSDYTYLFIGSTFVVEGLRAQIAKLQSVLKKYEDEIMPHLKQQALTQKNN